MDLERPPPAATRAGGARRGLVIVVSLLFFVLFPVIEGRLARALAEQLEATGALPPGPGPDAALSNR